ncbi:MAG: MOSC domain-containing protein, partial [Syntrophales bacterium]|nr:MOSC domain-containing protein [Syntrophales bacterium]
WTSGNEMYACMMEKKTMGTGIIVAICQSNQKGTRKTPVSSGIFVDDYGMSGDAHAALGIRRQVSLLSVQSLEAMKKRGVHVTYGDFAENLTVEGLELHTLAPGTRLRIGERVLLEITQIGKACHRGCAIFQQVGTCFMPQEGVFARVLQGGTVHTGDTVKIEEQG